MDETGIKGGKVVHVSPEMLCWFVNNESMNGPLHKKGDNYGKNDNNISPATVRAAAEAFRGGVDPGISTSMILCPAHESTGDPRAFLEAYRKATPLARGDKQVKMASEISSNCERLLNNEEEPLEWAHVLDSCFWVLESGGIPNEAYVSQLPVLITPQGQNRAAVMTSVFADAFGFAKSRAGRHGETPLFEGADATERLKTLRMSLSRSGASLPAYVYDFLTHKQARAKGRNAHIYETQSRTPGLYATVQAGAEFVRDVYIRTDHNTISSHVDEVLGKEWKTHMYPTTSSTITSEENKTVVKLQKQVATHVAKFLDPGHADPYKGQAYKTLAYASALKPDAHIIKIILQRLLAEDEHNIPKYKRASGNEGGAQSEGASLNDGAPHNEADRKPRTAKRKIDLNGKTSLQCLEKLFGLSERAQKNDELVQMILSFGMVTKVKTLASELTREDLLVLLARSLATRQHCLPTTPCGKSTNNDIESLKKREGVIRHIHNLVHEAHAADFNRNEGQTLRRLEDTTVRCFRFLIGSLSKDDRKGLTPINKQAIKATIGLEAKYGSQVTKETGKDHRQGNTSDLSPGYGLLPHLAISASTAVRITATAWKEWESHADNPPSKGDVTSGKRARMLATELVVLVVDRFVAEVSAGDDARKEQSLTTFKEIFADVDRKGILFTALKKNPNALSADDQPFFNSDREKIVKEAIAKAVAEEKAKNGRQTIRKGKSRLANTTTEGPMEDVQPRVNTRPGRAAEKHNVIVKHKTRDGNKKASTSLVEAHCPAKMLKALGLVDENGNQVAGKSVSVTIMNLSPDDDDDDDGGGGGSSDSNVGEREQRQIQPHDTHANGDVKDEVASPTEYSNNRDSEDGRKRKRAQAKTESSETSLGTSKRPANTHNAGGRTNIDEQNYEAGDDDFKETPQRLTAPTGMEASPPPHLFEDEESRESMSEIETAILEAREHFQQEALQKPVNEGHVSAWLKKKLRRRLFRNFDLAISASQKLPSAITTAYVFGPGALKKIKKKVTQEHLCTPDIAKYIFSPGDKYGSLLDMIVRTNGTEFPIPNGKIDAVWSS